MLRLPEPADNAAMETDPAKADPPKRKRRWFQFSLRTLLVAFTILIIWLGSWIQRAREQGLAIKAIQRQCDILSVWYDDQFANEKDNGYGARRELRRWRRNRPKA